MTTTIEHVRHRWLGGRIARDPRLLRTYCGRLFVAAHPVLNRRDIAHHEPATARCPVCFGGAA